MDDDSIRRLEELTLNAWPAPKQVLHDGWVARIAGGFTGRANSIHPLFDGGGGLDRRITFFESVYAAHGLPLVFKMTRAARPPGLATVLAGRGYRQGRPMLVQVLDSLGAAFARAADAQIVASDAVEPRWTEAVAGFRSLSASDARALGQIVGAIALPCRFALSTESGAPAACGLAVCEREWVGLYDITTSPDVLRRGHGTRVVMDLLTWARDNGASAAYLQVRSDNPAALALYEKLGFRTAYEYTYWRR